MALIHYAAKRQQLKITDVVKDVWQCSYCHARLVIKNKRSPSQQLAQRIADFAGISLKEFWGKASFNEPHVSGRRKDTNR